MAKTKIISNTGIARTATENLLIKIYSSMDTAVENELARLYKECGISITCRQGCCYCCAQHIVIGESESHAIAQHIKRHFSANQIIALMHRTRRWHEWNNKREDPSPAPGKVAPILSQLPAFYCPLLVDRKCSAYEIRPATCRIHYVCSAPSACRPIYDEGYIEAKAVKLDSVLTATRHFLHLLQEMNIKAEPLYSETTMLLPHWLAIEMEWDFAIG